LGKDTGKKDDYIGKVNVNASNIMTSRNKSIELNITDYNNNKNNKMKMIIKNEEKLESKYEFNIGCSSNNLSKGNGMFAFLRTSIDSYFKISKIREDGSYTTVYQSSISSGLNPKYDSFKILSGKLCTNDFMRKIKFDIYRFKSDERHKIIGQFTTTVNELFNVKQFDIKNNDKLTGKFIFDKFN